MEKKEESDLKRSSAEMLDAPKEVVVGENFDALVDAATAAKEFAYCKYSNFRVGAALLTNDGTTFTGCNVENSSYGLTICAERAVICNAVSAGYRDFRAIVVTSDVVGMFVSPCGACRQFIAEFGVDWHVYLTKPIDPEDSDVCIAGTGTSRCATMHCLVKELIPHAFRPMHLQLKRTKTEETVKNSCTNVSPPSTTPAS